MFIEKGLLLVGETWGEGTLAIAVIDSHAEC